MILKNSIINLNIQGDMLSNSVTQILMILICIDIKIIIIRSR